MTVLLTNEWGDFMREKKEKGARILNEVSIVICILLIPIILLNVSLIVMHYVHPDQIPGLFGVKPVAVLSGSMEDTIMTGDLIVIEKTDPYSLKEGDVICYLLSGQAVTHRIDAVKDLGDGTKEYITKGDANQAQDREAVHPDQIQGIWNGVRFAGVGNFVIFLSSPTGMILFIILPIAVLIMVDGIKRWRDDKREKARTDQLEEELARLRSEKEEEKAKASE